MEPASFVETPNRVGLFVPILNAEEELVKLLPLLHTLKPQPDQILFVDSSSTDSSRELIARAGYACKVIRREDFGHGKTRNIALHEMDVDIIVYLTQDAIPQHPNLIEALTAPFADPIVAHTVARQLPHTDATLSARFSRMFNYPAHSYRHGADDFAQKGIRAIFTSNSCAAYRRSALAEIGGFVTGIPSNEDTVAVGKLLKVGYAMEYVATAEVCHSHNYSLSEEFRRYFDTGVAHAVHPLFSQRTKKSVGKEGGSYVKSEIRFFLSHSPLKLLPALLRDGVRWIGYQAGRNHARLPLTLKRRWALNRSYWIHEYKTMNELC